MKKSRKTTGIRLSVIRGHAHGQIAAVGFRHVPQEHADQQREIPRLSQRNLCDPSLEGGAGATGKNGEVKRRKAGKKKTQREEN